MRKHILFPARRKIPFHGILAGLEGTTVVRERNAEPENSFRRPKFILVSDFLFRSATFFPSQKHDVFLIHLFPPENLLTVNFRLCKSPAQVRPFAKPDYSRPSAIFASQKSVGLERQTAVHFPCGKARQRFFSLKTASRF